MAKVSLRASSKAPHKLSRSLFVALFASSLAVIGCFAALFSAFFHFSQEQAAASRLQSVVWQAVQTMGDDPVEQDIDALKLQFGENIRYTLIDAGGQVLYDSQGEVTQNHANRPEFVQAQETGASSVVRHSETLDQDSIYAAARMANSCVLRASEIRPSYFAIVQSIAFPLAMTIGVVGLLSLGLSRLLARRILAPLNQIDVAQPLAHATYQEIEPLLERIDSQQRQLISQNQELTRAENLRREFSANVSHEMKTPLQVISGYAELLKSGLAPSSDTEKFASIMFDESRRMSALIDDVLVLSRLDDPVQLDLKTQEVELLELATGAARRLLPLAEDKEVQLRVLGSPVAIAGNASLLDQLVSNLISNAIRYGRHGGHVTVLVGKNLVDASGSPDPEAYIRVKDDGCGIAPEDLDKIFERFYRVDKSHSKESGGTGLGLAIAKHAADAHGATITVDSQLNEGSLFTVHFPLS